MMMKKSKAILYDPLIIPRVKQYLEENIHQTYVDVSVMARQLQERYREYNGRKSGPFRILVKQAYKTVLHSYGLDSNPTSEYDDEDANSEIEMMDDRSTSNNHMNNMLTNLYAKNKNAGLNIGGRSTGGNGGGGGNATNEAIDISSDESADDDNVSNGSKSNKPFLLSKTTQPINLAKNTSSSTTTISMIGSTTIDKTKISRLPGGVSPHRSLSTQISSSTGSSNSTIKQLTHDKDYPPALSLQQEPLHAHHNSNSNVSTLHINKKRKTTNNSSGCGFNNNKQFTPAIQWKKNSNNSNSHNSNGSGGNSNCNNHHNLNNKKLPLTSTVPAVSGPPSNSLRKFKKLVSAENAQLTFQNLGGMKSVLKELCELLFHFRNPHIYHHIGLLAPRGLLLHGPPGCGKTMLAEAIAGTLEIPFVNIPATELIAGVSGESEERIREVFEQATLFAPCVLFIDKIDAISSNRLNAQKDMERRIVAQLISSLDGLQNMKNGDLVLVVGATNRPEVVDPALRRAGRFDHEIRIGIPDRKARDEILRVICEKLILEKGFDFDKIAGLTPGYVGADLFALAFRAASITVKRKYFNQMRMRQAKYNMNIPIVDLLDDALNDSEIGVGGNAKSTETDIDVGTENNEEDEYMKEEALLNCDSIESVQESTEKITEKLDIEPEKPQIIEKVDSREPSTSAERITNDIEMIPDKNDIEKMEIDDSHLTDSQRQTQTTTEEDDKPAAAATTETEIEYIVSEPKNNETANSSEVIDIEAKSLISSETVTVKAPLPTPPPSPPPPPPPSPSPALTPQIAVMTKKEPSLLELLHWLNSDTLDMLHESDLNDMCLTMADFCEAVKLVQPSAKREGFITVPDVTWDDIGSLSNIREELQLAVLAPVKFPDKLKALGLSAPSGILLCGPPGCGKTLIAKAVANEAGINFISVKGPELMNMYVGESERAVRTYFQRARNSAPCVIFFDEFDSLCPKRSDGGNDTGSGTRIVNQLLTEMDGVEDRKGVYILAATNRPDIIDPAILRPGRLDTILYVGLPDKNDRVEILKALTKNRKKPLLDDDVDIMKLANLTDGYTGADLAGLLRQASLLALKDSIQNTTNSDQLKVVEKQFENALNLTKPSVSLEDRKVYEELRIKYAAPRQQGQDTAAKTGNFNEKFTQ